MTSGQIFTIGSVISTMKNHSPRCTDSASHSKEKAVGIKDIAGAIQVSHNTASEHIKRLLKKKYVYKTRSVEDERKVILKLTSLGRMSFTGIPVLMKKSLNSFF